MRVVGIVFTLAFLSTLAFADDSKNKPLTPAEARKKVDEKCTVQMEVKSVGARSGVLFLNSSADFKSPDNFTVFINQKGVETLRDAKVEDPIVHFKNKTIRVTGMVKLFKDRPEMVVEKADQIQFVDKKD